MKEVIYQLTGKTKITVTTTQIRIKHSDNTTDKEKNLLLKIAHKLQDEYNVGTTIRGTVIFDKEKIRITLGCNIKNRSRIIKDLKEYI